MSSSEKNDSDSRCSTPSELDERLNRIEQAAASTIQRNFRGFKGIS